MECVKYKSCTKIMFEWRNGTSLITINIKCNTQRNWSHQYHNIHKMPTRNPLKLGSNQTEHRIYHARDIRWAQVQKNHSNNLEFEIVCLFTMLGISVIRVPGMRCIKQNVKSLLGILFTEAAFLGVAFLIFLLLLISFSFRRLTQGSSYAENGQLFLPNGNRFRPIINHKQLLELQSPGMCNFYYSILIL